VSEDLKFLAYIFFSIFVVTNEYEFTVR